MYSPIYDPSSTRGNPGDLNSHGPVHSKHEGIHQYNPGAGNNNVSICDTGPALTKRWVIGICQFKWKKHELRTQNHLFASFTSTIQSDNYTQIINDVKSMETCIKISSFDRYHANHQI